MTRLASIMGVAAVATIVLLSGCETPMKTDYAKKLEGTWTTNLPGVTNPMPPPAMLPGTTAIEAAVTRSGPNKGSVSLTITGMPTGLPALPPTTVKGDIEVTGDKIKVSAVKVEPTEVLAAHPAAAQALAAGLTLEYELSDDDSTLTVTNETLFTAVLTLGMASLELTKQAGDDSSS